MNAPRPGRHGHLTHHRDRIVKSFEKPLDAQARRTRSSAIASPFMLYFVNKCERRTAEG
jgi:hypothetical protein